MTKRSALLIGSAVLALAVYLVLWIGWRHDWPWVARMDDAALDPALRYGESRPGWVTAWDIFCTVLGPGAFRIAVVVIIVVAFVRRRIRLAVFLIVSVELSGLVTETAKHVADRARPDTAMVSAWGLSFPSGHALGVFVAVAALLTVAKARPAWLVTLGVVVVVTIGIGRVVLNVHHPSDILAGWALGYAYFVLCLLAIAPNRDRAATQPVGTPEALDTAR